MKKLKTNTSRLALTVALTLGTALITPMGYAQAIIDARIRPAAPLQISSSNAALNEALANSINYVYDSLVVGPQQYPTTEIEPRITKFRDAGLPAQASLWGSYHGTPNPYAIGYRENFCLRDIAHQTQGAALLSLNEENISMLQRFAFDALQAKRIQVSDPNLDPHDPWATASTKSFWQQYWTLWSYNFYGFPYYMDAGFQELPAPLELLEKIYAQYEYTGDPRWLDDTFIDYGRQLHEQFIPRYDFNGNGIVDNRGNEGILPTLWEFEGASHLSADEFSYDASTSPGTLVIKKAYLERQAVQDMSLKVRFNNGKDDYLNIRVNQLADTNGQTPLLSNDYIFIDSSQTTPSVPIDFQVGNGVSLVSVTDGGRQLTQGADYGVSGNRLTLSADYLNSIKNTKSAQIKSSFGFNFSDGSKGNVVVEFNSHGYVTPLLDQHYVTRDWNDLQDIVLRVDLSQTSGADKGLYRIENNMNRVVEAGDTLGVQYQATLAMAGLLRAKAALEPEQAMALLSEAQGYDTKAANLLQAFRSHWYDADTGTYARAFDGYGHAIYGWGHENSFFMAMKELLEPGQKADNYLQFIHSNSSNLNEEAITYLPEAFYNYGKNDEGWYWLQKGLTRFANNKTPEQQQQTYPEIAFTNVSNVIGYMMGYEPKVQDKQIATLSRLTGEVNYIQVDNLPVGQRFVDVNDYNRQIADLVSLRHDGTYSSTLTNSSASADTLNWKAQFAGNHPVLYVDGVGQNASIGSINGVTVSYISLDVASGETRQVSTGDIPPCSTDCPANGNPVSLLSLTPTSVGSDWGTTQYNKSILGNPLSIAGGKHAAGIGTHANGEIHYRLNGQYDNFSATVGIDDETSGYGSVAFRVLLDGELAFDSGVMSGNQVQQLDLDVSGVTEMTLVSSDGGDGISSDHADWGTPVLQPHTEVSLPDLTPTSVTSGWGTTKMNRSIDGNGLQIAGISYAKGIGTHSAGEIIYRLDGQYRQFLVTVGVDDETGNNGSVGFQVYLDGSLSFDSGVLTGADTQGRELALDVSGVTEMRLRSTDGGDGISYDHADWADPRLVK